MIALPKTPQHCPGPRPAELRLKVLQRTGDEAISAETHLAGIPWWPVHQGAFSEITGVKLRNNRGGGKMWFNPQKKIGFFYDLMWFNQSLIPPKNVL